LILPHPLHSHPITSQRSFTNHFNSDGPLPPPWYKPTPVSVGNVDAGGEDDPDIDMDAIHRPHRHRHQENDDGDDDNDEEDLFDSEEESSDDEAEDMIFGADPWNAICVLGLRVYHSAEERDVGIRVVVE
jgi:hypothetical protein